VQEKPSSVQNALKLSAVRSIAVIDQSNSVKLVKWYIFGQSDSSTKLQFTIQPHGDQIMRFGMDHVEL
jgi:hypothetical protein